MSIIQLSKFTVSMKNELSWYDAEEVKSAMLEGVKMSGGNFSGISGKGLLDAKIKTWEKLILEIKEGEKIVPFSLDWVRSLSREDGSKLDEAIDNIDKKKV